MKIRFMSSNKHKIAEVQRILAPVGVDIIAVSQKIQELQTEDVYALVKDKLIKAFGAIGRPLFVEHTGLYLSGLNGLPAGLTQIFWDQLEADRFASLDKARFHCLRQMPQNGRPLKPSSCGDFFHILAGDIERQRGVSRL